MSATNHDDLPAPGTVLAGKYSVVRVLGEGGMGIVLEARHLRLGQGVALKMLRPTLLAEHDVVARFEREARAIARLQGPHVARILDVEVLDNGTPFMVMELLRGRELDAEIQVRGKLPVTEAVGYVLQACAGMSEAHRMGIIHRDIKPSNLFLSENEGYRSVKLLDFGISKLAGDVQVKVTTTATAFGTPLYMSPEQVRSAKDVDARADIWSIGVVLYELLSGKSPFDYPSATAVLAAIIADNPTPIGKLCPDLPRPLADAVTKALQKDPNARFPDVRALAAAIAPYGPPRDDPSMAAVVAEIFGARGDAPAPAPLGGGGSRKGLFIGVAALAAALSLAISFLLSRGREPAQDTRVVAEPASPPRTAGTPTGPVVEPAAPEPTAAPVPSAAPTASSRPIAPTRQKPIDTAAPTQAPKAPRPPSTDDPKYL